MPDDGQRLFIAVNLPADVQALVGNLKEKLDRELKQKPFGFRWLPPENWHFTLVFLGYQKNEFLEAIQKSMAEAAVRRRFIVEFEKAVYGPVSRLARMIWLTTTQKTDELFGSAKSRLEKKLEENGVIFQKENRIFHAHLTLARFEPTPFRNLSPLEEKFSASFEAETIDLMKSVLKRSGAEYEKIFEIAF